MKLFNLSFLAALMVFAAACGKDNKSGGSGNASYFGSINTNGQTPAQSLSQLKSQLAAKAPNTGLIAGQYLDFYQTTVSQNTSNWWIFNFSTYSSSSSCQRVRVMNINTMDVQLQSGTCSNYVSSTISTITYDRNSDASLQEFMNISDGTVVQVRSGSVNYLGQNQPAYLVQTSSGDQYVVAPNLPLLANPVMKKNIYSGNTEGVIGAQVQIQ